MPTERPRVLLIDAAPGELLETELRQFAEAGLDVTLNLWRVENSAAVRSAWGGRIRFADFDGFDQDALTTALIDGGAGHDAVKSRAGTPLTAALFAAATGPALARPLRVAGRAGAGTNHIDVAAAARHGVQVTHTPGSNALAVAEFALGQILALTRNLIPHNSASHLGAWQGVPVGRPPQLADLRVGIVGFGSIGRELARLCTALGMTVRTAGRSVTPAEADRLRVQLSPDLDDLVATCEVVSLHLPLTPATKHLFDADRLAAMRPGSFLVNTARGEIVDEAALADALRDPRHPLAGAAVDTFTHEHAAFDSPLFGLPNALLTPHIAGMTGPAMAEAAVRCAQHIAALLADRSAGVPVVPPGRRGERHSSARHTPPSSRSGR